MDNQVVVPKSLRKEVFLQLHNSITAGHFGVKKTLAKVRHRFHWYGLRKDVTYWCKQCDTCASRKTPHRKAKSPMKIYNVGQPLERIAVDIQGPYPITHKGNHYIMVVGDCFTKWLQAIPLQTQEAHHVATELVNGFISQWGTPMEMHTDRASNFESKLFQEVCKLLGIHKTRTTASRPMSDGFVERGNRTIETMLSAFVDENQRNWDEKLPLLNLAYNSSIQETTGVTPSMMMLGREMNLRVDLAMGKPADNMIMSETDYAYQLEQRLAKTHEFARANLDIASHRMKRQYDRNTNYRVYETGEAVWVS